MLRVAIECITKSGNSSPAMSARIKSAIGYYTADHGFYEIKAQDMWYSQYSQCCKLVIMKGPTVRCGLFYEAVAVPCLSQDGAKATRLTKGCLRCLHGTAVDETIGRTGDAMMKSSLPCHEVHQSSPLPRTCAVPCSTKFQHLHLCNRTSTDRVQPCTGDALCTTHPNRDLCD